MKKQARLGGEDANSLGIGEGIFEEVEIARKEKADVAFNGRLLGMVDSRDYTRPHEAKRDRWTRFEVWETEDGNWVIANIGCSDRAGEIDVGDTITITPTSDDATFPAEQWAVNRAMAFFGWTWLAKNLAEKMGWNVLERIA